MWDESLKNNLINKLLFKIFAFQFKQEEELYKELGRKNSNLQKHPSINYFMYKGIIYPLRSSPTSYILLNTELVSDFFSIKQVKDTDAYRTIKNYLIAIININHSKTFLETLLPSTIINEFIDSTSYLQVGIPLPIKEETQESIDFIKTNYKEAAELLRHILITQFLIQE